MSHPLNPKGLGKMGGFNANIGADPFALRTVQGAAQHYAQQRGGRTVIRPTLIGKRTLNTVPLSGITYIDADNPSTNYSAQTAFTAYSNAVNSYGNKKKILLKLLRPQEPGEIKNFLAMLNGIYALSSTAQFSGDDSILELSMGLNVRLLPIIEDFDIATVVWNDFASLSLGTYYSSQWAAGGLVTISGLLNPTTQTIDKTRNITWGVNDEPSLCLHGKIQADETLYGLAVEIAPTGAGSPSSASATLTMRPTLTTNPTIFEGYHSGIVLAHDTP